MNWIDEKGLEIPTKYITPLQKRIERQSAKMLRDSEKINKQLADFKEKVTAQCHAIWIESLREAGLTDEAIAKKKGNHTIYNFDRSIKIEVAISERIDFDDALITAAKDKFDDFLTENTSGTDQLIRELIMEAFNTSHGKLDAKKVMGLVRYRNKISARKYPNFHAAVDLIEQAIRRPDSKKYFRIWKRDDQGQYQNVDLNFSSI